MIGKLQELPPGNAIVCPWTRRYAWEPDGLIWRPVWLYPPEKWLDPASALGPQHDALRPPIAANLKRA